MGKGLAMGLAALPHGHWSPDSALDLASCQCVGWPQELDSRHPFGDLDFILGPDSVSGVCRVIL